MTSNDPMIGKVASVAFWVILIVYVAAIIGLFLLKKEDPTKCGCYLLSGCEECQCQCHK